MYYKCILTLSVIDVYKFIGDFFFSFIYKESEGGNIQLHSAGPARGNAKRKKEKNNWQGRGNISLRERKTLVLKAEDIL